MDDEINIQSDHPDSRLELGCAGDRIKCVRGSRSREDFSLQMGVSKSSLARYENGERMPDAEFLLKLYNLHRVTPLWVLTGKEASQEIAEDTGSHEAAIDQQALEMAIETLDETLEEVGLQMHARERAELIGSNYGLLIQSSDREATLKQIKAIFRKVLGRARQE